jgi:hypothetical protein
LLQRLTHASAYVSSVCLLTAIQGKRMGSGKGGSETSGWLKSTTDSSDGPGVGWVDVTALVEFWPFDRGFEATQAARLDTSNSNNIFFAEFSM